ncbi:MAG: MBL fold metallo-hydrolase, partial [Myxococcota bacterium]
MSIIGALAVVSSITPSYELHSVCFARVESAPARAFIVDPELPKRIPVTFAIHVIRGSDRTVLIDTGFERHQVADGWKLSEHRSVVELLREIGVEPDDITDVILTHAHWDHWQGLGNFPQATVWLSKRMAA